MGSACCVAAKDRTITNGSPSQPSQRHACRSPSWSFRWDNRGSVTGEEPSEVWVRRGDGNDRLDIKSSSPVDISLVSEEGSPLGSTKSFAWQKSPASDRNTGILRHPTSDPSASRTLAELKESTESPAVSSPSPVKLSPSAPSVSSPLPSQIHLLPPNSTPSRWYRRSPGHQLLRHVSESRIPEYKSPTFSISEETSSFVLPAWGSNDGSSDSWAIPSFSELRTNGRERWSFDSAASGFSQDKIDRSSRRISTYPSFDLQTCGVCTKLLTERSSWASQKIITTNEVGVVAVLICGHVYHAECLEYMTPEINKYDPNCPVCTLGEKQAMKISKKAEMALKARKGSRNRVVDADFFGFDHHKGCWHEGKSPNISSSSSRKSSSGKSFLRRHFSFGSKGNRSLAENHSTRRRGFFWTKSIKE